VITVLAILELGSIQTFPDDFSENGVGFPFFELFIFLGLLRYKRLGGTQVREGIRLSFGVQKCGRQ
jgi:hypothetical protein